MASKEVADSASLLTSVSAVELRFDKDTTAA
jgi:hypothetical protein